jgi:hypothetical protein
VVHQVNSPTSQVFHQGGLWVQPGGSPGGCRRSLVVHLADGLSPGRRRQAGGLIRRRMLSGDMPACPARLVLRTLNGTETVVPVRQGGVSVREAAAAVVQQHQHYPHAMSQRGQVLHDGAAVVDTESVIHYVPRADAADVGFPCGCRGIFLLPAAQANLHRAKLSSLADLSQPVVRPLNVSVRLERKHLLPVWRRLRRALTHVEWAPQAAGTGCLLPSASRSGPAARQTAAYYAQRSKDGDFSLHDSGCPAAFCNAGAKLSAEAYELKGVQPQSSGCRSAGVAGSALAK